MNDWTTITGYLFSGLTAVAGWWVGRAKQKNDFLADLQNSISLLTAENTKLLAELLDVKKQNFQLMANQEKMKIEIEQLRSENKGLREELSQLNTALANVKTITKGKV